MITASASFLTANAKQQKRPIYIAEIETYPWAFCNRKVDFPPEPVGVFYDIVEGPYPSASGWDIGSHWDNASKTLRWIGHYAGDGSNVVTVYSLHNEEVEYLEVAINAISFAAGISTDTLYYDGEFLYLGISSIYDNAALIQVNLDGTENSRYINAGGIAAPGPFTNWGVKNITSGEIGGAFHVFVCDIQGRASLLDRSPLAELATVTCSDGRGTYQPIIDKEGNCWVVSGSKVWAIDWSGPTATPYACGSGNAFACYVPADNSIIVSSSGAVRKFDLDLLAVTETLTYPYGGMSTEIGSDGFIVLGCNKLNPLTMTVASNADINDFGVPAGFWNTGGNNTFAFTRPYDAAKNVFYAIDLEGNVWGLRLTPIATAIRPWMKNPDDLQITVDELSGSSSLGQLSFTVLDIDHLLTADFPTFVFEGKKMRMWSGFPGMLRSDFVCIYTGVVDSVESSEHNLGYSFVCSDGKVKLNQVIWETGDDGEPTSNDHPHVVNGHPLDILLAILEDELSMLTTEINVDKISRYRDEQFAGMQFVFNITSPPTALDFIQKQLLIPLAGYCWNRADGVFDVNFMVPLDPIEPAMTLNEFILDETPQAGQTELINSVSFRFDKNETGNGADFLSEAVAQYAPSIEKYGLPGPAIIESDGVRAGFQGYAIATTTSRLIFTKYGNKNLTFDGSCQWRAVLLEPGDFVLVSHPHVPDRVHGIFGITDWIMQVLDRTWNFNQGRVTVRLMDASGLALYGRYKIAPNSVPAWTLASAYEQDRYMFICDDNGLMSDGSPAPTLG